MALLNKQTQLQLDGEFTEGRIRRLEVVAGRSYTPAGGWRSTNDLLRTLNVGHGDFILDVGCGLGGASIQMAKCGAHVVGLDLSSNMIGKARDYLVGEEEEVRSKIAFQLCDVTRKEFLPLSFDFIYCRETLMYFLDKETLMTKFRHWLKPGGKILIAEYCAGEEKEGISNGTPTWVTSTQLHLSTMDTLKKMMEKNEFQVLEHKDKTLDLLVYLQQELSRLELGRNQILNCLGLNETRVGGEKLVDEMSKELNLKIASCLNGETTWGYFLARKQ